MIKGDQIASSVTGRDSATRSDQFRIGIVIEIGHPREIVSKLVAETKQKVIARIASRRRPVRQAPEQRAVVMPCRSADDHFQIAIQVQIDRRHMRRAAIQSRLVAGHGAHQLALVIPDRELNRDWEPRAGCRCGENLRQAILVQVSYAERAAEEIIVE